MASLKKVNHKFDRTPQIFMSQEYEILTSNNELLNISIQYSISNTITNDSEW